MSIEHMSIKKRVFSDGFKRKRLINPENSKINNPKKRKVRYPSIGHDSNGTYQGFIGHISDAGWENQRRRLRILIQSDETSDGYPILVHRELTVPKDLEFDIEEFDRIRVGYAVKDNQAVFIWSLNPGESLPFS